MRMTLKNINNEVVKKLKQAGVDSPQLEANIILTFATGMNMEKLFLNADRSINQKKIDLIEKLTSRKTKGEPTAYITKNSYFYSLEFHVNKNTLIPRPETEQLVSESLKLIQENNYYKILDLCCGSGCIGISILKNSKNKVEISFSDISKEALEVCKKNIKKHKVNRYSKILNQDLYGKDSKKYDLIVSNPPYVSKKDFIKLEKNIINFEPRLALISDKNGIYHLEKIILESQKNLKIGGSLIVEVGASQASKVIKIFKKVGFNDIVVSKDLNKIDRIISAKWTK